MNGYPEWLARMPTDDSWHDWQDEGLQRGYIGPAPLQENGYNPGPKAAIPLHTARTQGAQLVRISDGVREHIEWEWLHRLPRRKVAVIEGDPSLGKSTLTTDLAARATTGRPMPGTELDREPTGVVILTAEDGLGDTVRPRLEAAGADLMRVAALTAVVDDSGERMPHLPDDLAHVEQAALDMRARLIVIDPLMAYLSGDVNSHRDQDVRRALAPAAAIAERTGAAVAVVRHLNKSNGASALYRGGGSIGITGAARSVLLVAADPEDEARRIVAVSKSNLAPIPPRPGLPPSFR